MINKKYLELIRLKKKIEKNNFIYNIISKRIVDSIDLIKTPFQNILELGINENYTFEYLKQKYLTSNFFRSDFYNMTSSDDLKYKYLKLDFDEISLKENKYELIYSNSFIHYAINIENLIKQINKSLKSNGFFIATIPDRNNIYQLVNSMYETDKKIYGGVYRRFNPTIDINNIIKLLKKFNFEIPIINNDKITIEYDTFEKLLFDIKSTNSPYIYLDRKKNFENKKYFNELGLIYKKNYYKNAYIIDINVNIISAWKK